MARKKSDRDEEVLMVGLRLMGDMFSTAMATYNISYDELDVILRKLRYWEIFNDPEVTLALAHDFEMDGFLTEIGRGCLNNDSGYTTCICSKALNEG